MQTVLKTDKEFEEFKTYTLGLLHDSNAKDLCVTFTKKDGSYRVMHCTLHEDCVPEVLEEDYKKTDEVLSVYDIDKFGWRSFRWDSIKKIEFNIGE